MVSPLYNNISFQRVSKTVFSGMLGTVSTSLFWLAVKSKRLRGEGGGDNEELGQGAGARQLTSSTCTLGSQTVCLDCSWDKGHFGIELFQDCPRTHKRTDKRFIAPRKDTSCRGYSWVCGSTHPHYHRACSFFYYLLIMVQQMKLNHQQVLL